MRYRLALVPVLLSFAGTLHASEPIVGLPCEGCEAVFEGMPQQLHSRARISQRDEPGGPMLVTGTVTDSQGKPRSGVVVYAYQTNNKGVYPTSDKGLGQASHRHGLLRAWALTDAQGRYAFDTIRPAGYAHTDLPAHIHMHVLERGCSTYYIDDIMFEDDPRLTRDKIRKLTLGRGGDGIDRPRLHKGVWYITRDIVLGRNIPGYTMCAVKGPAASAREQTQFTPRHGFGGASEGNGTLNFFLGKDRPFHVESSGNEQSDGTFRLEQKVTFQGKPPQDRAWIITTVSPNHYSGTLSDAAGPMTGSTSGSRLLLQYRIKGPLVMHQVLDLAPDGKTIYNAGTITFLGIPVGYLHETIKR